VQATAPVEIDYIGTIQEQLAEVSEQHQQAQNQIELWKQKLLIAAAQVQVLNELLQRIKGTK
jgi:hypothetical protein